MLEKPDIADATIVACLGEHYGTSVSEIEFLPLGADRNTAVYKATSANRHLFVKLRRGDFDETAVSIPKLLHDRGVTQVIAPIPNLAGRLWTRLEAFGVILYPFVEGANGFEQALSARNWVEFGQALRQIHTVELPPPLLSQLRRETFSPYWRVKVRAFQTSIETRRFSDPVAAKFVAAMLHHKATIGALVEHAHRLGARLQNQPPAYILCHADIHVGNLLITPAGTTYIVDWDTLVLAPKERDLMFVGMGLGSHAHYSAEQQTALFYKGYGKVDVDLVALAYYRCERIVQDIYEFCEQVLFTEGDSADRETGLRYFQSQFEPEAVVERAFQSVEALS